MKVKQRLAIISVLLVSVAIAIAFFSNNTSASSITQRIDQQLANLGVTDAQNKGEVSHPLDEELKYILYTSEANQKEYYFSPQSGELEKIVALDSDSSDTVSDMVVSEKTEEVYREEALRYAEAALGENLIGELRITTERVNSTLGYFYIITEYYDGYVTGSEVTVDYDTDGVFSSCIPTVGKLFVKNQDGTYSLKEGYDFIDRETAIQNAYEVMMSEDAQDFLDTVKSADLDNVVCGELEAKYGTLVYVVRIPYVTQYDWDETFIGHINAYTGECIDYGR